MIWYSREWDCGIDGWVLGKPEKAAETDTKWAAFLGCQIYLHYKDALNNVHCACDLPHETTENMQLNKPGDREYIGWMALKSRVKNIIFIKNFIG